MTLAPFKTRALPCTLAVAILLPGTAIAADPGSYAPPPPPVAAPPAPPPPVEYVERAQPPAAPPVDGQWVYTRQYGWVWMPYDRAYTYVPDDGEPSMYIYATAGGWRWVTAPWVMGWGPDPYWGVRGRAYFAWYSRPWFVHREYRPVYRRAPVYRREVVIHDHHHHPVYRREARPVYRPAPSYRREARREVRRDVRREERRDRGRREVHVHSRERR